jgi:hypothetical protein
LTKIPLTLYYAPHRRRPTLLAKPGTSSAAGRDVVVMHVRGLAGALWFRMRTSGRAASYAEELLSPLGYRWLRVQGVARQARQVTPFLPAYERDDLVAAAYLHDLGSAPALVQTGLHPLDGARHLRALGRERLAGLVAYHAGARAEAELRGLAAELAEFADEASATSTALTYCDMTTDAAGEPVTLAQRLADVERRYGAGHVVTRSIR